MTPVERTGWRLGLPAGGHWSESLNTDAEIYGGANRGNMGGVDSEAVPADGFDHSVQVTLPPLSGVYFTLQR
jgi:1,4-alpha-glucan branching enzyme